MERIQGRGVLASSWLDRLRVKNGTGYAHSIALGSGKGGTGKSVITASLAAWFAQRRKPTIVFDADLGVGNAHILQGVSPAYTAAHVVSGLVELSDIGIHAATGVTVLPAGSGIAGMASLHGEHLRRIAGGFENIDTQGDCLFVDGAAGISDQNICFLLGAERILVVTSCDLTAMTDAYALIKILHHRDADAEISVLVNRARSEREAIAAAEKIQSVSQRFLRKKIDFLGWIPDDPFVVDSVAKKRPFLLAYPEAPASRALAKIAEKLEVAIRATPHKGRYSARLDRHLAGG